MVEDGAFSRKQIILQFFKEILKLEGHQNRITGSKVTAILLTGWILPIGGASSGSLQPAQQAGFYVSSVLYYLYFLHCFSSMNQGMKIVVYVRRQTANIHIFQCYLPSYIPNLYTTVENGKYPFNKVNIKFCIFDPLWLSGLYVSLKQQPFKG